MVMCAFSKQMFDVITIKSPLIPFIYISQPTTYAKYIRQVLMSWISDDCINITHIIPNCFLETPIADSELREYLASDSDDNGDEDNIETSIPIKAQPLTKNANISNIKREDGRFYCHLCNLGYGLRYDLKKHISLKHRQSYTSVTDTGDCLCLECGHRCCKVENLREHLTTQHGIGMELETVIFDTFAEYENWRYDLEEKTKCSYVNSGAKQTKMEVTQHLKCNRSGKFKSKRVWKRRMKSSGTSKIENNCTSTLRVITKEDSKVEVTVCYTHYGHGVHLEHIRLTKPQRHEIAAKLWKGVCRQKILDDIRDDVGIDFRKIHLCDKKDIRNIINAYNVDSTKRHENDQQSVLSWILEWESAQYNPVLYYKFQGQPPDFPCMKKEDFIIVLQTEAQKRNLRNFGKNGICADATHGTTGYEFLLSTLLVVDEFGHGQPSGWCLATHETEDFLQIFFSKIAENSGIVQPRWFMSDMATEYYEAFCTANACSSKRLLCTWHVDKAWKKALNDKVKNVEIEAELYLKLKMVQEITNENLF